MATRADIRTRARARADQDNSTFPTDAQYDVWIDDAAKEAWYDLLMAGWPINYSTATLTATGSSPLALGASGPVAMVRGVFRRDSGGTYVELQRMQEGQRAGLLSYPGNIQADYYDALIDPTSGVMIELLPPPASGTYRVDYVPEYPGFASDTTVWYGPARSDELIVLRAASKGLVKEGDKEGAAELDAERQGLLQGVLKMASWLDARNPAKIRDVESMKRFVDPFAYQVDGLLP